VTRRVLIVAAHPAIWRSRANRALREAVAGEAHVTLHDLYETYPDHMVDVDAEQDTLARHDAIVLLHPFYWYSLPSLMKEWLDLTLEHGWAYGPGGDALRGKPWLQAITTGGAATSYGPQGYNRFTIEQLLAPLEATAALCGCPWQAPHVVHGARTMDASALMAAGHAFRDRVRDLAQVVPAVA
jgi:glutathione-regulated potassium-efflux system ancillary protein KefG